jgi:hypothetical protein
MDKLARDQSLGLPFIFSGLGEAHVSVGLPVLLVTQSGAVEGLYAAITPEGSCKTQYVA